MAEIRPGKIYTSAEVAALLFGHGVDWFYAWRRHHGAAERFPRPLSDNGHPRWAGAVLLAWMARPRPAPLPVTYEGASIVDIRRVLASRSKIIARRA